MRRSRKSREIQDVRRSTSNISTQWLLEEKYKGYKGLSFAKDVERLQSGEHVDYVIGFVDFLGCKIDLLKRPFIPRPETEYWVGQAIQDIRTASFLGALPHISPAGSTWAPTRLQKRRSAPIKCLDLFAGSGCIGIAILKHIPGAVVDFGEKDRRLLLHIRLNAKKNGIAKERYKVVHSDVFSGMKRKYDYIFANPPYLAESRKHKVQKSVLKNESKEALFAGKDGLTIIRKFLGRAKDFLVPGGKIYMEFDSFQKPAIAKILRSYGFRNPTFYKDQYDAWRYVKIVYNKEYGSRARTTKSGAGRGGRFTGDAGAVQP